MYGSIGGFPRLKLPGELVPIAGIFPDTEAGGVAEETGKKRIPLFRAAHTGQHDTGAAFLHADVGEINIQCARSEETLLGEGQLLGGHVIDVAGELQNLFCLGFAFTEQHANHIGAGKVLEAGAVADPGDAHGGHAAEVRDKVLQQGGSGGCAELSENVPGIDGDALEQFLCRRGRDRKHAVGTAHGSAADMNRRGKDLLGRQFVHQVTDRDHIRHGIQGTDLVEVDVLHGVTVDMGFRRGDQVIDRERVLNDVGRKVEPADKRPNLGDGGMVMMVVRLIGTLRGGIGDRRVTVLVVMVMLVLMMMSAVMAVLAVVFVCLCGLFAFHLPADGDGDMAAGDAALLILSDRQNGFSYVTLDLSGYRTGSMNEVLKI